MPQPNDLLAVLVDADNVSPARIGGVLAEIAKFGTASVKRVYGDWTKTQLRGWKDAASEHVIQPMQQFDNTTGKNATDSALIIDAMDLLYTRRFQGFCIVSSDSDFTRLASRIREEGVTVYGFGERKTPEAFRNACDQFTYLEVLVVGDEPNEAAPSSTPTRLSAAQLRRDAKLVSLLRSSAETASDDDGWADFGTVGQLMRKQQPDFDARNWGYAKLSELVKAIGLFTIESKPGGMLLRAKSPRAESDRAGDAPAGSVDEAADAAPSQRSRTGSAKGPKAAKAPRSPRTPRGAAAEPTDGDASAEAAGSEPTSSNAPANDVSRDVPRNAAGGSSSATPTASVAAESAEVDAEVDAGVDADADADAASDAAAPAVKKRTAARSGRAKRGASAAATGSATDAAPATIPPTATPAQTSATAPETEAPAAATAGAPAPRTEAAPTPDVAAAPAVTDAAPADEAAAAPAKKSTSRTRGRRSSSPGSTPAAGATASTPEPAPAETPVADAAPAAPAEPAAAPAEPAAPAAVSTVKKRTPRRASSAGTSTAPRAAGAASESPSAG